MMHMLISSMVPIPYNEDSKFTFYDVNEAQTKGSPKHHLFLRKSNETKLLLGSS